MGASTYAANLALNFLFRNTGTAPTTWYVGLLNGDDEVTGTGYARVAVTFLAPIASVLRNDADLSFGVADSDWGEIDGFGIYDASTAGNLLASGTLTTFTPDGVETVVIAAGEAEISLE